jgi:hypothetical protein
MRKKLTKKLYTLYTVEGKLDDIRKDPNHIFSSYSSGKAECIQYHDTVSGWLEEIMYILSCEHKHGFGIRLLDENSKYSISYNDYSHRCYTCECNTLSEDRIIEKVAKVLTCYFDEDNSYYYEFEDDHIFRSIELTGHMYRNSPHETCDSCGNCDGARCDSCKKIYVVEDLGSQNVYYKGFNKNGNFI